MNEEVMIALCDEEQQILKSQTEAIQVLFSQENTVCHIDAFASSKELFETLNSKMYDIVFLDIDMPEITGFDLAEKVSTRHPSTLIIFVTSHDELVFPTFRYHPFRFIRKQFFDQEIEEAVHEAVRSISEKNRMFEIQTPDGLQYVYASDILFAESDRNYLNIITRHGTLRCRDTISHKEKEWASCGFVRPHSGFLVNQKYIYAIDTETVRMRSKKYPELPLSKRRRDQVIESYQKYLRK